MDTYPSQPPSLSPDGKTPHVMIVGAGLSGLLLGILLDRMGVPFEIFERTKEVRPLGAVMGLSANILPVFEQLGLYEELQKISYPAKAFNIYKGNMKKIASLQTKDEAALVGYEYVLFARPRLYALLLSRVAPSRIHFGKKIMSIAQNKEGVMIRCNDGTTYHGNILVGADGAYSGVRQGLYKQMQTDNTLPQVDMKALSKGFICMVGTTGPLDPAKYPGLSEPVSTANQIIGDGTQYSWSAITVPDNRICWNVVLQLATTAEAEDERFRNSEWGPESTEAMIKEVKDFRIPFGPEGTLGDLIDATPKDTISKVFLEDKLFETWYHGRTVLIGDACHKLLPSAGQGAVNAMQDAVILANCIYDLRSLSPQNITAVFENYRDQRYPRVKEQYEASKTNAKIIYGQSMFERAIRNVVLNYLPKSVQTKVTTKNMAYRPQVAFLPQAAKRGSIQVLPQKPSTRYQAEQDQSTPAAAV